HSKLLTPAVAITLRDRPAGVCEARHTTGGRATPRLRLALTRGPPGFAAGGRRARAAPPEAAYRAGGGGDLRGVQLLSLNAVSEAPGVPKVVQPETVPPVPGATWQARLTVGLHSVADI